MSPLPPVRLGGEHFRLIKQWLEVERSGHWTEGTQVERFENLVSFMHQEQEAVAFNSAGTALFSVARCMGLSGRVIVAANTFFATGAMLREAGCTLVLADCSPHDFSLDLKSVEAAYTGREKAVVLTHVGGGIARDYRKIAEFCKAHGLLLLEDAAHAFGAIDARMCRAGHYGDAAVFSFYPTKAVPVGEGGMVVTPHRGLAEKLRAFRNYGKVVDARGKVSYTSSGFNFRMDEWTAAVAVYQVQRLEDLLRARHKDAGRLYQWIKPMVSIEGSNCYKYIVNRREAEGMGLKRFTGQVYASRDQLHNIFQEYSKLDLPVTRWVAENHVCLPLGEDLYGGLTDRNLRDYLGGRNV